MDTSRASELRELQARFEARGFHVSHRPYFADHGLLIALPPRDTGGGIAVIRRAVFVYGSEAGWTARVTPHGGPHWLRRARTLDELDEVVSQVLASEGPHPSGPGWHQD